MIKNIYISSFPKGSEMSIDLESIPKRRLTELEKQVIDLRIEKLRLNRERAVLILNKGTSVYFAFIILAILGFMNNVLDIATLNVLVLVGLVILIASVLPYSKAMQKEESELSKMLDELTRGS